MDRARLLEIPFFAGAPDEELDTAAFVSSELEVSSGQPLTKEGDFGHCLFVIESGTAEVSIDGVRVHDVGPGDVIGEVAVLASGRRTASVVATSQVRALAFFKRDVWALEIEAPEIGRRLRAVLDQHVRTASVE